MLALHLQGCSTQHWPTLWVRRDPSAAASPACGGDWRSREHGLVYSTTCIAWFPCTRGRDHRPSAWAATQSCRTSATMAETPGAAQADPAQTWQRCQEEQGSTSPGRQGGWSKCGSLPAAVCWEATYCLPGM